jgi:presenilin-like A22 family membrane protease
MTLPSVAGIFILIKIKRKWLFRILTRRLLSIIAADSYIYIYIILKRWNSFVELQ